jgi:hypothetical protein
MDKTARAIANRHKVLVVGLVGDLPDSGEVRGMMGAGDAISKQFAEDLSKFRGKLDRLVSIAKFNEILGEESEFNKIPLGESDIDEILNEEVKLRRCLQGGVQKLSAIKARIAETTRQLDIQRAEEMQAEVDTFDWKHGSRARDLIGGVPSEKMQALARRHDDIWNARRKVIGKLETFQGRLKGKVSPSELSKIRREMTQVSKLLKGAEQELLAVAAEITEPSKLFRHVASNAFGSSNLREVRGLGVREMSVIQAREMWRQPARAIAMTCFDGAGKINMAQVTAWRNFFANRENFNGYPYDNFPLFEHVRFQMFCVLENLCESREFVNTLERANVTPLGAHGQAMFDAVGGIMQPSELILMSLFSSHRQSGLPTCTLNSWMNNMLFNHPQLLAKAYASVLANGNFHALSGRFIQLPPISNGHISVDLERGGNGRNEVFEDIDSGDRKRFDAQVKEWQNEGIAYTAAVARYRLNMPALDLNDLCFAGLFQMTFGDNRINDNSTFGTMHVLAGFPLDARRADLYSFISRIGTPNDIPDLMAKVQREARVQRNGGVNYMRMAYGSPRGGHAFNVNIAELLALDLDKMKDGEVRSIGDFNWVDPYSIDIVRLAIRKTGGEFQLGKAMLAANRRVATGFIPMNIDRLMVYKTEIRQLSPSIVPKFSGPKLFTVPKPVVRPMAARR